MISRSEYLSSLLGYISIGSWLGAQFPQLLANARLQSVEHLALPFLVNWLFGDITNLLGCLLTNQLPFQTWVATYFCFIDICLFAQYMYYSQPRFKKLQPSPAILPTSSYTHTQSRSRTYSGFSDRPTIGSVKQYPSPMSQETAHLPQISNNSTLVSAPLAADALIPSSTDSANEANDEIVGLMSESILSSPEDERGRGASNHRRNVSWGPDPDPGRLPRSRQHTSLPPYYGGSASNTSISESPPEIPINLANLEASTDLERGRPLTRPSRDSETFVGTSLYLSEGADMVEPPNVMRNDGAPGVESSLWTSKRRKSVSASKRSATIIFLAVWFLFNMHKGIIRHPETGSHRVGVVLNSSFVNDPSWDVAGANPMPPSSPVFSVLSFNDRRRTWSPQTTDRVIGRVSAWMCATLYLTSRLPQIWKNFSRKSVEGLRMSLFVCAFLGNLFYVASILTNPTLDEPIPISTEYISESIPYLLGSGGTLLFDVTIVAQSFIYRDRSPVHTRLTSSTSARKVPGHRVRSSGHVLEGEESEPLLHGQGHGKILANRFGRTPARRYRHSGARSGSMNITPDVPTQDRTVENP